ncbi:hypothetical protein JXA70_04180 [candidate division KSB1 bacterium]|nr:hypothetical protein [candidate division KSB1 bacterium]
MKLVSFDPFRTVNMPNTRHVASKNFYNQLSLLREVDWILFPEYWQVNILFYVLHKRIFPSMATYHLGHNKIEMTRALTAVAPQHVPETHILSNTPENQERIIHDFFSFPFVAKEVKNSSGHGVFLIENKKQWREYCLYKDVLYVQEALPIQRDMRIVVIGRKAVTGYWRAQTPGRFHTNVAQGGEILHDEVPLQALVWIEWLAQQLAINHAGFDVADINGHFYIFEFNRLFGNQGLREKGIDGNKLIYDYLWHESHFSQEPQIPRPARNRRRAA